MARVDTLRYAWNRGLISPRALGRVDLKRMALATDINRNWISRSIGSTMLRPGRSYIGTTASNAAARFVPFIRATTDTALIEFVGDALRVWINDALLTRPAVSSAVVNGNFTTNLANWTDSDEIGSTSQWAAGGYMQLTGTGTSAAIRDQQVTVAAADQNVEHALRIVIFRGPVTLRVGSTSGDDDYITETALETGHHSLAFTPAGDFHIRLMSRDLNNRYVDSCNVESSGVVSIPSPYDAADLSKIRANTDSQSADVLFVACSGYQQRRIERRSTRSWSVVQYKPADGPFRTRNTGAITITPSNIVGNITLTASAALFKAGHAASADSSGSLWQIITEGQQGYKAMTALNDVTSSVRVTGLTEIRTVTIILSGMTAGRTVILERSFDDAVWVAVPTMSWAADITTSYNDTLDNQIVYYRLKCSVAGAAGSTNAYVIMPVGTKTGVVRIIDYTSPTSVSAEVLSSLGGVTATSDWAEGLWSDLRGWPTAVAFYEGRIAWAGKDNIDISTSDAFDVFTMIDELGESVGDSGPILRTIGSGPVDTVNWVLPLQRLILGGEAAEHSCKSSALDEPLTPTNFNIKPASTQGSSPTEAARVDARGLFVQRGGRRLFELAIANDSAYEYAAVDLSLLIPEIGGEPGSSTYIKRIAVQRQPDTRVHCVRSDGVAAMLVYDRLENVICWIEIDADSYDEDGVLALAGYIEDVVVLPGQLGDDEDQVYYVVKRTINGADVRYLEKWANEDECAGDTLNRQADSFIVYSGVATTTITGLAHLEGEEVVVWGGGKDLGRYTVSGGEITGLSESVTSAVVGLHYRARIRTAKLGQTVGTHKNIEELSPILSNTHIGGVQFGQSFDNMNSLPLVHEGMAVSVDTVYESYDVDGQWFPGTWDADARLCIEANAPRPAEILAVAIKGQVA